MSGLESKIIDVNGIATGVTMGGRADGKVIVFLHGGIPGITPYAGGAHVWAGTLERFAPDYRVVAIDLLGSARTGYPDAAPLIDDFGSHIRAALEALSLSGCHVVGHDLGGVVALWLAMNAGPLVASISVVASADSAPLGDALDDLTFLSPPGDAYGQEAQYWAFDRLSYTPHHIDQQLMQGSLDAARGEGAMKARAAMAEPRQLPRLNASMGKMKSQLWALSKSAGLRVPAQFIWGANDPLTPRERGFVLFETVGQGQPHCQFHLVPRSGSFVYREHADHFHNLVAAFVEGLAETPPEFLYPRETAA